MLHAGNSLSMNDEAFSTSLALGDLIKSQTILSLYSKTGKNKVIIDPSYKPHIYVDLIKSKKMAKTWWSFVKAQQLRYLLVLVHFLTETFHCAQIDSVLDLPKCSLGATEISISQWLKSSPSSSHFQFKGNFPTFEFTLQFANSMERLRLKNNTTKFFFLLEAVYDMTDVTTCVTTCWKYWQANWHDRKHAKLAFSPNLSIKRRTCLDELQQRKNFAIIWHEKLSFCNKYEYSHFSLQATIFCAHWIVARNEHLFSD